MMRLKPRRQGALGGYDHIDILGDVRPRFGTGNYALVVIGHEVGGRMRGKLAHCASASAYDREAVVQMAAELRAQQVGADSVGMTAYPARGIWYGGSEESTVLQFMHFPDWGGEATAREFYANIDRLADGLAKELCQDAVLALHWDGRAFEASCASHVGACD